jgi:hypothetical protein
MTPQPTLLPFDLAKALAGAPVVTRDGHVVTELTLDKQQWPVRGVVDLLVRRWTKRGFYYVDDEPFKLDLFLLADSAQEAGAPWRPKVGDWFILKGSYCGADNENGCTDASPCSECLAMSNRFMICGEHGGCFFFDPQFCTRGQGCHLDETSCSVLYTGDTAPRLHQKEGRAYHISETIHINHDDTQPTPATSGDSMDVHYKQLEEENAKLRQQIHDLCHDKHVTGPVTPDEFCAGCEAFQKKLFGHSPIEALRSALTVAEQERDTMRKEFGTSRVEWKTSRDAALAQRDALQKRCDSLVGGLTELKRCVSEIIMPCARTITLDSEQKTIWEACTSKVDALLRPSTEEAGG